jgi:hypothetical protein
MQEKHLFEYAVIRMVPRVERGEFLNIGVVLYCPTQKFLKAVYHLDEKRIRSFCSGIDVTELLDRLRAFDQICGGAADGGPIGKLPIASRFRWLTAARSTVVQTSPVHPGLCQDADETLSRLYNQLVQ